MAEKPDDLDFELTKYGYDRQHELELNKFTHNLEMEQLKLLILLNGGAATALLTFADGSILARTLPWLLLPVLLWLAGLIIGAWATIEMRDAQSGYSKFYRHRRNATEWDYLVYAFRRRGLDYPIGISQKEKGLLETIARDDDDRIAKALRVKDGAVLHDRLAKFTIRRARRVNDRIVPLTRFSLGLFVAGVVAAAGVTALAPPPDDARAGTQAPSSR